MNFDALDEIIAKNTDLHFCAICGTPFRPYHRRQKTCGTEECKRAWNNMRYSNRRKRLLSENPEEFRAYRREAERKSRRKKRNTKLADDNYQKLESYWLNKADRRIETDGLEYGKKQAERTLASVPKIDVSGFRKGDK